ncbi:type II secretion system protein GspG [Stieleria sp.]
MSRPSSPFAASTRRRRHHRRAARHAFTLLELLLVLAILVVLGGIVAVNVVGTGQAANADATMAQMKMLKSNIDMFQIRMNSLPQTLEELRDGPSDAAKKAKWVAPIITEIPKDAWGNDIDYSVNGNSYELRSGGIDGQKNTEDDIVVTP